MGFVHFDPKKVIIGFKGDFDRLFEEFFGNAYDQDLNKGEVSPDISIEDKPGEYVIRYELAGLNKDDVKITFQDEKLFITGEKKEREDKGVYLKNERTFGKIARGIEISMKIDQEKIDATFENGLLTVLLPKIANEKEPGIEVNIN